MHIWAAELSMYTHDGLSHSLVNSVHTLISSVWFIVQLNVSCNNNNCVSPLFYLPGLRSYLLSEQEVWPWAEDFENASSAGPTMCLSARGRLILFRPMSPYAAYCLDQFPLLCVNGLTQSYPFGSLCTASLVS